MLLGQLAYIAVIVAGRSTRALAVMDSHRFAAAFLVAPAAPAFIFVIPSLFLGGSGVLAFFYLACLVTYAHAAILGLPAAWLLARSQRLTAWRVVGAAFVVGALPFAILNIYQEATMPAGAGYSANGVVLREDGRLTIAGVKSVIFGVMQCGLLGAASGVVWWLIAKPRAGGSK